MPSSVFPTTPPPTAGRARIILVVGIVALVVAVVVGVIVWGTRTDSGAPTPGFTTTTPLTAAAPSTATSATSATGFSGTTLDKFNNPLRVPNNPGGSLLPQTGRTPSDPTAPPTGLMWQRLYDLPIVPFSTSDGPTVITDGVVHGWKRTPQGAALAAITLLNLWINGPDAVAATVERSWLSGDPAFIRTQGAGSRVNNTVMKNNPQLAPVAAQVAQTTTYTDDFAQVSYASGPYADDSSPDGFYTVQTLSVTWSQGEWRLIVTPTSPDKGERQATLPTFPSWVVTQ